MNPRPVFLSLLSLTACAPRLLLPTPSDGGSDAVAASDVVATPDVPSMPDVVATPDVPSVPDVIVVRDVVTTPDVVATPDVIVARDVADVPDVTTPDVVASPDVPPTCAAGFGDCDGASANGCEARLDASPHCGACGRTCGTGQSCTASACVTVTPAELARPRAACGSAMDHLGRVYLVGGQLGTMESTNLVERWDPATNLWSEVAPLPLPLLIPGAASTADGRIWIFGGFISSGPSSTARAMVFNPATNAWTELPPMPTARHLAAAARGNDGRFYVFGGTSATMLLAPLGDAAVFDPVTNAWSALPAVPTAVWGASAVTAEDGRIFLFGGTTRDATTVVQVYDPATRMWSSGPALPAARSNLAATRGPGGRIYILGGQAGGVGGSTTFWSFTPSTGAYADLPMSPVRRTHHALAYLRDGRMFAVAGYTEVMPVTTASLYSFETSAWR